jgi:hypothetical protein
MKLLRFFKLVVILGLVLIAAAGWTQAQSRCGLGTIWDDTESGLRMTWTRQGDSNVFKVTGEGTIQKDGVTVIGTYSCTKYKPSSGWKATIKCEATPPAGVKKPD